MTAKKSSTTAAWTDPDDAPALGASFFKKAEVYEGPRLKARGRPKAAVTKEPVKLRLDADVLAAYGPQVKAGKRASTMRCAHRCDSQGAFDLKR